MAETERGEVSRQAFQVAYGGPDDPHTMDVQDLAPALVAFGRLVREANAQINGKRATVRLLVTSDFEHKCFNISFEVLQSILDHVVGFLKSDEVKTAREILGDLGFLGSASGLGSIGYLKLKKGKPVAEIRDSDSQGVVIVQMGDGNVANVSRNALKLAESPKIRAALEATLAPLGTDSVSRITFKEESGAEIAAYDAADAAEIISGFDVGLMDDFSVEESDPDTITAWLRVYSPVFDEKAEKWRFFYGDHPIYADISETSIGRDAILRGASFINDLYKVKMEVTQHLTKGGNQRLEYKIIEVLDFRLAHVQGMLGV